MVLCIEHMQKERTVICQRNVKQNPEFRNAICATIKIHEWKREVTVRLLIYMVSVDPGRRSQRRTDGSFVEYSVVNRRKPMTVF